MYSVGFIQPEMNTESSTIQPNTIAIGFIFFIHIRYPLQYYINIIILQILVKNISYNMCFILSLMLFGEAI
jgi:hypothetical protein